MDLDFLLGANLEVAVQIARSALNHYQIVNFLVPGLHDISGQIKLTVQVSYHSDHEIVWCSYFLFKVMEEILKLLQVVIKHIFDEFVADIRG